MSDRITKNSYDVLTQLAECRILTTNQLSAFNQRSCQVIRKNIRMLTSEGLIGSKKQGYGHGRGRPENIIFLTQKGIEFLQDEGILSGNPTFIAKKPTDSILVNHHLLVNWFHIHLIHMEKTVQQLSINFLSPNSHVLIQKNNPSIKECIQIESGSEEFTKFIPDGAFSLTYQDSETNKTLLFFLEVDMDTETLASENRNPRDIRQKVINYQALFRRGRYKRYERIFSFHSNVTFEKSLAEAVAEEKARNIPKQRRSIKALGKSKLKKMIMQIFEDISFEEYIDSKVASEYGINKSTFSRFAGSRWNRKDSSIPDLWRNTAHLLANNEDFKAVAVQAGVWDNVIKTTHETGKAKQLQAKK